MIALETCKDRVLYRLMSRNLRLGVFCAARRSFLGIREKFGARFAAEEFHWETGAPFGTAKPQEELAVQLPDEFEMLEILPGATCATCGGVVEYNGTDAWRHIDATVCPTIRPTARRNWALEEWLEAMETTYADRQG